MEGQEFLTLTNSPLPLSGDSLSSGWNQEKQKTQTQIKPAEKNKEKKINPETCKWNPGAISSAVTVQPKPLEWFFSKKEPAGKVSAN